MNETLALPPRLVMRDLMLTAVSHKARTLLICFCVMAASVAIAVHVQPDYKARSTLLVLMGAEHALRPAAGQVFMSSSSVDAEQVLRTEASILGSDDLHRSVIREISIEKLYPKLLQQPTAFEQWMVDVRKFLTDALGLTTDTGPGSAAADPMVRAVDAFAHNLTITVDKKSSVILLEFANPDKTMSADALRLLESRYFDLRSKLYGDIQAPIVQMQQNAVGTNLAAADRALEQFKQQHDISNFGDRRTILLKQQGDLETALTKSDSTIAEQQARLGQLNTQLGSVAGSKRNAASALQGMVEAYKQRQQEAQTTYRGSPAVDDARRQALERETDIARMQTTQAYSVQTDRNKTEADLRASLAGHDTIVGQLTSVKKQLDALDSEEVRLHGLERNRAILEDNFKAVSKILDERQVQETVDANRESSVRIIQPPRIPALPQPTRKLILLAGVIISMLLSIGTILMSHFFRSSYLRPEALEVDTGLTVLASVPEMGALRGGGSLLVVQG